MAGNSFGEIFKLTTFGESHGPAIGGIIDGCPAGLELDLDAIEVEMNRRKPGQSAIVTQRKEPDTVKFLSGVFEGVTTGTPIGFVIENTNQKSKDYSHIKDSYRPSHADYTYDEKYGIRDYRGGGRSSARETATRVAAGAIAKQLLKDVKITAYVSGVGGFEYGSGFAGTQMKGSEHNDSFNEDGSTKTNHSGGVQGGISNGEAIYFNVAFKPVATIMKVQETIYTKGNTLEMQGKGRHDPCVVPRAVPIVEAMAALVIADFWLLNRLSRISS